jgi:hypothetical protein
MRLWGYRIETVSGKPLATGVKQNKLNMNKKVQVVLVN